MKYSLMLILIFALPGASRSQADDVLPPRFNFDRYSRMVDHSPFAIATAVALPSATPNFATLTFNQALLSQPPPNMPPSPLPSQPNVAGRAAPMLPPATPPLQAPRPHVRGVIQRNPKAAPMPAPNRSNQ